MILHSFYKEWLEKYTNDSLSPGHQAELYKHPKQAYLAIIWAYEAHRYKNHPHYHQFYERLKKGGRRLDGKEGSLSNSSIANCYRSFNNVLSIATKWKLIKENPAKGIKPPTVKSKKSDVYSKDELNILFDKLESYPLHW